MRGMWNPLLFPSTPKRGSNLGSSAALQLFRKMELVITVGRCVWGRMAPFLLFLVCVQSETGTSNIALKSSLNFTACVFWNRQDLSAHVLSYRCLEFAANQPVPFIWDMWKLDTRLQCHVPSSLWELKLFLLLFFCFVLYSVQQRIYFLDGNW